MHYIEIDLSNRLEESGPTFLALSNDIAYTIKIPTKVKRIGTLLLASKGISKNHIKPVLWAGCVFLLLQSHLDHLVKEVSQVVIDNEFDGYQVIIKRDLIRYIRRYYDQFPSHKLIIDSIGKHAPAHHQALQAKRGRKPVDKTVTELELVKILEL